MNPSEGLQTALNEIRETLIQDSKLYQEQLPLVEHYTSSQVYGQSLLALPSDLRNKFIQSLVNRIAYTKFQMDYFENPLRELANDELPLGAIGQDVYINPARGRVYDINDFAGLLAKYESDVKVEYNELNYDVQFPVTIVRKELEKAFNTWGDFESFLMGISQSLYNGAYITRYNSTKGLALAAFNGNGVKYEVITNPTNEATAKALVRKMRADFSKFQIPSTKFNAWADVKGEGAFALKTWSDPEDVVVLISADVEALIDTEVLAAAFNMSKTDFLGRVIVVDDFTQYNEDGTVAVDGSMIKAMIADKSWFKIKTQDFAMDEFYNANNRTWQYYLNDVRMVNYSLFANAKVYTTAEPTPSGSDS